MKKKISLRGKLTALVCFMVIPLNLMVAALSARLIQNTKEQLAGSYESGLELLLERQQRDIGLAETEIQNLFEDLRLELEQISRNKDTRQSAYLIWQRLQEIREKSDFMDAFYLTLYEEQEVYMTHHPQRMSNRQMQELKEVLKDYGWMGGGQGQIEYLSLGEDVFFIGHLEYSNYGIGYLIRGETLFQAVAELLGRETGGVIQDGDGKVQASWNMEGLQKEGALEISRPIWNGGDTIRWYIPRDQAGVTSRRIISVLGILSCAAFGVLPLLWAAIRHTVLLPLHAVLEAIDEVKQDHLDYQITQPPDTADFAYVYDSFNRMITELKALRTEKYEYQIEKLELEAENLRLQVNPHLLLNSFNMIFNMARSKNYESIQEYTLHLVDYFRYALKQDGGLVRVDAEMKFVSDYLKIQEMRYPDAVASQLLIQEGCREWEIPPLIIENFVENAVKYGRVAGQQMKVQVAAELQDGTLVLKVEDNGVGFEPEVLQKVQAGEKWEDEFGKSHIGICNCRRRLKLFYGERAKLDIDSEPGMGTSVCIRIDGEAGNDNTDCR